MADEQQIHNFCIIAHIDHGKSTLADRFLELTGTVEKRMMREQLLDTMELEREKGITIKLQPVRMFWKGHMLNLIDTPGHVDFQYEVSRSLQSVEGAILLVDATQGIQAQTISNLYLALEHNLSIIPVINKIDLPSAHTDIVEKEICQLLGVSEREILRISAKTGEGVENLLDIVLMRVPRASTATNLPLRALIFDSKYDDFKGVIAYVRIVEGQVKLGSEIMLLGSGVGDRAVEVGTFLPQLVPADLLGAGHIGYIATGLKDIRDVRVGDTMTTMSGAAREALSGFTIPQSKVFAGIYPANGDDFSRLRDAVARLQLNDASFAAKQERSNALGQGFRCGFLGMLHLEIVQERLRREFDLQLVITMPSVEYRATLNDRSVITIHTADAFPDQSRIALVEERFCSAEIIIPGEYLGKVFSVMKQREAMLERQEHIGSRIMLTYVLPLRELVVDLYDEIKSVTSGYGSLSYAMKDWRPADVVKLSIIVHHESVSALSHIIPRIKATSLGRRAVERLRELLPRQQFAVPVQAAIGGTIVARETLPALRKDVTGHLYGGDVTRKRKLLERQKKGKKRLSLKSTIEIPPSVFIAMLRK